LHVEKPKISLSVHDMIPTVFFVWNIADLQKIFYAIISLSGIE
jgi:hypothetical protein